MCCETLPPLLCLRDVRGLGGQAAVGGPPSSHWLPVRLTHPLFRYNGDLVNNHVKQLKRISC